MSEELVMYLILMTGLIIVLIGYCTNKPERPNQSYEALRKERNNKRK